MQVTLGTSGAETLSAAANIFVGQTEAPLVIRPYIPTMTISELNAIMIGGFATMAGGVLAAYVDMGISAKHLLSASVMAAPAGLMIAKILQPEVDEPKTLGHVKIDVKDPSANVLEAIANGAVGGLQLALNVGAMLIVFLALIALVNLILAWIGAQFGYVIRFPLIGAQSGAEPEKEHLAAAVTTQRLHRSVVDDLDRTCKRRSIVESDPACTEVTWLRNRTTVEDRSWKADRHRVVRPLRGNGLDAVDHLLGGERGPRGELSRLLLSGGEHLHVGAADIDDQHTHTRLLSSPWPGPRFWRR